MERGVLISELVGKVAVGLHGFADVFERGDRFVLNLRDHLLEQVGRAAIGDGFECETGLRNLLRRRAAGDRDECITADGKRFSDDGF